MDRATPYDGPVSIDPRITTAAANIALRLGKINSPLDFDEWLKRYPTHRQEELRAALNKPYNTTVDTFHKVEKLDDTKTPRTVHIAGLEHVHPHVPPYRDWETDRKSTRLNSSHSAKSRMPSSA